MKNSTGKIGSNLSVEAGQRNNPKQKILVAPCSFKGSLSASEAASAIAQGLQLVVPSWDIHQLPLADGGEGTLAFWQTHQGASLTNVACVDALGRPILGKVGWRERDRVGMIEAAQCLGFTLLAENERDPGRANSRGLGMLVRHLLDREPDTLWIALGGTATVDGGVGMLAELGVNFLSEDNQLIETTGNGLARLGTVDWSALDPRLNQLNIKVYTDVDNRLLGQNGARVFMPQKGADETLCNRLEQNLAHLYQNLTLNVVPRWLDQPGYGAAGGLGAAFALLNGELYAGSSALIEPLLHHEHWANAYLAITGEGRLDHQSLAGKAPVGLLRRAAQWELPVVAWCGELSLGTDESRQYGFREAYGLTNLGHPRPMATSQAAALLEQEVAIWFPKYLNRFPPLTR